MARKTKKVEDYHLQHLGRLKGGTICGILVDPASAAEFGQAVYGIRVEVPTLSGQRRTMYCWILCDPEGNGPGFLDIQEAQQAHEQ
jgi:hypothetical protein